MNRIGNRIARTIGILSRIKYTVPNFILKIIYSSLILSYLNYGILVWGFETERLLTLQKKAVRLLNNAFYLEHTDKIFKQLKILKVDDIFKMQCLQFYFKFKKNCLPDSISNILSKFEPCHHYSLRSHTNNLNDSNSNNLLTILKTNTSKARECVRHSIPELVNDTTVELRSIIENSKNLTTLKIHLKNYFINQYSDQQCDLLNCYPCSRKIFQKNFFSGHLRYLHIFHFTNKYISSPVAKTIFQKISLLAI